MNIEEFNVLLNKIGWRLRSCGCYQFNLINYLGNKTNIILFESELQLKNNQKKYSYWLNINKLNVEFNKEYNNIALHTDGFILLLKGRLK